MTISFNYINDEISFRKVSVQLAKTKTLVITSQFSFGNDYSVSEELLRSLFSQEGQVPAELVIAAFDKYPAHINFTGEDIDFLHLVISHPDDGFPNPIRAKAIARACLIYNESGSLGPIYDIHPSSKRPFREAILSWLVCYSCYHDEEALKFLRKFLRESVDPDSILDPRLVTRAIVVQSWFDELVTVDFPLSTPGLLTAIPYLWETVTRSVEEPGRRLPLAKVIKDNWTHHIIAAKVLLILMSQVFSSQQLGGWMVETDFEKADRALRRRFLSQKFIGKA